MQGDIPAYTYTYAYTPSYYYTYAYTPVRAPRLQNLTVGNHLVGTELPVGAPRPAAGAKFWAVLAISGQKESQYACARPRARSYSYTWLRTPFYSSPKCFKTPGVCVLTSPFTRIQQHELWCRNPGYEECTERVRGVYCLRSLRVVSPGVQSGLGLRVCGAVEGDGLS